MNRDPSPIRGVGRSLDMSPIKMGQRAQGGSVLFKENEVFPLENHATSPTSRPQTGTEGVRTHFSKSKERISFPPALLINRYMFDEFESKLLYSPDHTCGQYIDTVDLRYWEDLTTVIDSLHEKNIQLQSLNLSGNQEVNSKFLAQAGRIYGHTIHTLHMSRCHYVDEIALAFLGQFKHLTHLDISEVVFIRDDHVEKLVVDLPILTHLNINGCIQLTDRTLIAISQTKMRFKSIEAAMNTNYTDSGVMEIMFLCERLEKLDLSYCSNLRFVGLLTRGLYDEINMYLSRSLKILRLDGCCNLNMECLDYICGALPELEEVTLPYVYNVKDASIQGLAYGCNNMTKIHLQGCKQVKSQAVRALGTQTRHLRDINIANIGYFDSESLSILIRNNRALTYLNVSNNKGIKDDVFSELEYTETGTAIMLPKLKRLSIAASSLTSFGVACLAERAVYLEHLDISDHENLTNAALSVIAGCCRQLRSLWLNDCEALSDDGVTDIAYNCKKLEVLHLSSSVKRIDSVGNRFRQYTDVTLEALLDGCRTLRELSLRNQCDIHVHSPWLLTEFARRGGHQFLEKVDLRGSDELDLVGLSVVCQHCSELCFVLTSPEKQLTGITNPEFWINAFSHCLYTAPRADLGLMQDYQDENYKMAMRVQAAAGGGSVDAGPSMESMNSVQSATAKLFTEEGEGFHKDIEHGRYFMDDGSLSMLTEEHRKHIDRSVLDSFSLQMSSLDGIDGMSLLDSNR